MYVKSPVVRLWHCSNQYFSLVLHCTTLNSICTSLWYSLHGQLTNYHVYYNSLILNLCQLSASWHACIHDNLAVNDHSSSLLIRKIIGQTYRAHGTRQHVQHYLYHGIFMQWGGREGPSCSTCIHASHTAWWSGCDLCGIVSLRLKEGSYMYVFICSCSWKETD